MGMGFLDVCVFVIVAAILVSILWVLILLNLWIDWSIGPIGLEREVVGCRRVVPGRVDLLDPFNLNGFTGSCRVTRENSQVYPLDPFI
jgi:hypothetical protein